MGSLEILAVSVLTFTAVKASFGVLQWILEEKGDPILRGRLDYIYDRLDRLTLRQLSSRILFRTITSISDRFLHRRFLTQKFAALFFGINIVAYAIAQGMYCSVRNECGLSLGHDSVLTDYGVARLLVWLILTFLGSTIVQLACISLVWRLMQFAAKRFTSGRIALCLAVSLLTLPVILTVQYFIQQGARLIAFDLPVRLDFLFASVTNTTPYFWATVILAFVAALPVVIYLLVLLPAVIVRASPNFVRTGVLWVIFKITTDKTPVLDRLGSAAGGIASLSSALAGYLKS